MNSRSSFAAFSFTLSLILWHCVLISAEDTTAPLPASTLLPHSNQQAMVGWVNNPKRRGTLTIIIDCLTTIFACTWTVLHLNIPAITDSATTRILRKVKWMAITILFPEFIFVKAVCELRFALYTLGKMSQSFRESPEKFDTVSEVDRTGRKLFWFTGTWTVEYKPLQIMLHKLLLGHAPYLPFTYLYSRDKWRPLKTFEGYIPGPVFGYRQVHKWTLIHAYYVNMGGIVAQNQGLKIQHPHVNTTEQAIIDYRYPVVRGDHFAVSSLEAWRFGHPLQNLQLSVNDIMDRNKADWIVRTIAIIQIGRLILELITRSIGGQPVTQLEIATASFAVFAIVTQLVNWWKPKDVTQPTLINSVVNEESLYYGRSTEPLFTPHLWSPGRRPHRGTNTISPSSRIADDELWTDKSNLSLTWPLMIGSCLAFGGIHCTAWSFWFPTRVEQVAWQAASLVSMNLPVIGWATLYMLYLYRPRKLKRKLAEVIEEKVGSFGPELLGAEDDWWKTFTTAVNTREWDDWVEKLDPIHTEDSEKIYRRDSERLKKELQTLRKLRDLLRELWRSKQLGESSKEERIISAIWDVERELRTFGPSTYGLRDQYEIWVKRQDAFLYGTLPKNPYICARYKQWLQEQGNVQKLPLSKSWLQDQATEKFLVPPFTQPTPGQYYLRYGEPDVGLFSWIFSRITVKTEGSDEQCQAMWREFDIIVQTVNIFVTILYTVARLMLIAIMFSSLRASPAGVYDTPDWTRFLPSFS